MNEAADTIKNLNMCRVYSKQERLASLQSTIIISDRQLVACKAQMLTAHSF